jgi:cysteine desulfurase
VTRIYLDHNATSPLRPEAREAMRRHLEGPPGNASSAHSFGHDARMSVEGARDDVARLVGARPEEIVLTGGGTESNNLALFGAALVAPAGRRRIVTSSFEHPSVLAVMDDLRERGFEIVRVDPDRSGVVPAGRVLEAAGHSTAAVSIMLANNEVGTLQPVGEIGAALRRRGILFHSDAAQGVGKVPVDVGALSVDLLSIAGHKFGGPQGTGALFVRRGLSLEPHLRGGGQELHRRPGTENVAALAGLGAAAKAVTGALPEESRRTSELRSRVEDSVLARGLGARVNAGSAPRVPNTTSLAFEGVTGEALVVALDLEGIAVSAGSACSAGTMRRSHVLEAMGMSDEARRSIRVSLGPTSSANDVEALVTALEVVLRRLRRAAAVLTAVREHA